MRAVFYRAFPFHPPTYVLQVSLLLPSDFQLQPFLSSFLLAFLYSFPSYVFSASASDHFLFPPRQKKMFIKILLFLLNKRAWSCWLSSSVKVDFCRNNNGAPCMREVHSLGWSSSGEFGGGSMKSAKLIVHKINKPFMDRLAPLIGRRSARPAYWRASGSLPSGAAT